MDTIRICKQCGKPLAQNAPQGLCPECLAKVALDTEPGAKPEHSGKAGEPTAAINVNPLAEAAPGTRVPPRPGELAPQFPQLVILELLGMGGMGIAGGRPSGGGKNGRPVAAGISQINIERHRL